MLIQKHKIQVPLIILLISCFLISGCNEQEIKNLRYELANKEEQIEKLKSKVTELESEVEYLNQFRPDASVQVPSKDKIVSILKDKLDFYCSDLITQDFKISRINNQTFDVSYIYKKKGSKWGSWNQGIQRVEFLPNGKYRLEIKSGPICTGAFSDG